MNPTLTEPSLVYEQSYGTYIAELGGEERHPYTMDFDHRDFPGLLRRLQNFAKGVDLPEGFVPSSTFWLVEDGEVIGASNLRHFLNDRIRHVGGHIGLGVRPSRRGCGLGNLLLALTIREARKRGIDEVHVHCYRDNIASSRMIVRNGGILQSEFDDQTTGEVVQRYVITAAP